MGAWLYILRCADGSYYTGTTRTELALRVAQHQQGLFDGYTSDKRPVELVFSEYFERIVDAIVVERRVKGWFRAKKEALIADKYDQLRILSRRKTPYGPHGSRRRASRGSSP
ncbi:MAG: GIY-YIG nuclease family protein [Bradyrhizobiaceae bacterium]|nr:GIY-YIG nuclease family protein [Bradyrhizobiaceae bacterium]